MDELDGNSSHKIKDLLGLWIDPEQENYSHQKELLKTNGLIFKIKIPNKYIELIFAESSSKTIANSLIPKFFSKMICFWDFKSWALRRSLLESKVILFKDDLLNIKITTKFGSLVLSRQTITGDISQDNLSEIIKKTTNDLELISELYFEIQLVEEGALRFSSENESLIYNSYQWANVVRDNLISRFKTEWVSLAKPLLLRRLDFFKVAKIEDIPQDIEIFGSKNLYVYNSFANEMGTKTNWFITNEDCLWGAQKDYEQYISNYYKFRNILENKYRSRCLFYIIVEIQYIY